ncbi:hypothetical protein HDU92_000842, partial [Lobulomyces angularis]
EDINVNLSSLTVEDGINLQETLLAVPKMATKRNNAIEKQLKKDQKEQKLKGIKILVLGPGDSGKSTFIRQMRLLGSSGFTQEEKDYFKIIIYENIVTMLNSLLDGLKFIENSQIDISDEVKNSIKTFNYQTLFNEKTFKILKSIWENPNIKLAYEKRKEFNIVLQDTSLYFLDDLDRFLDLKFFPLEQ